MFERSSDEPESKIQTVEKVRRYSWGCMERVKNAVFGHAEKFSAVLDFGRGSV